MKQLIFMLFAVGVAWPHVGIAESENAQQLDNAIESLMPVAAEAGHEEACGFRTHAWLDDVIGGVEQHAADSAEFIWTDKSYASNEDKIAALMNVARSIEVAVLQEEEVTTAECLEPPVPGETEWLNEADGAAAFYERLQKSGY